MISENVVGLWNDRPYHDGPTTISWFDPYGTEEQKSTGRTLVEEKDPKLRTSEGHQRS